MPAHSKKLLFVRRCDGAVFPCTFDCDQTGLSLCLLQSFSGDCNRYRKKLQIIYTFATLLKHSDPLWGSAMGAVLGSQLQVQAVHPSFGCDAWRLLDTSKTGFTKADTMAARRKGWGEGIKPKPHGILRFAQGQTRSKSISEELAPHQNRNFWYKKKRGGNPSHFPHSSNAIQWFEHLSWVSKTHFLQMTFGFVWLCTL